MLLCQVIVYTYCFSKPVEPSKDHLIYSLEKGLFHSKTPRFCPQLHIVPHNLTINIFAPHRRIT
jgi:hypothetical protein